MHLFLFLLHCLHLLSQLASRLYFDVLYLFSWSSFPFHSDCLIHFSYHLILGLTEVPSNWFVNVLLCPPPVCSSYSQQSNLWNESKTISLPCIALFSVSFPLLLLTAILLKLDFRGICLCFTVFNENFSILCVYFTDNHFTNNNNLICVSDGISVKQDYSD